MHIVHVYDGHEQVYEGRGSVPGVVWNVARETAARGHDVTVLERQWRGLSETAVHEGVRFERMRLRTGAEEPWTRVPYEEVTSPVGASRLVGDRTNFALHALWRLRELDPDVIHVHLPFAANVMIMLAPWLRRKMVYTAHLGDLRMNLLAEDSDVDVPGILELFSPDVFLAKRCAATTVLNPEIREAFVKGGVPDDRVTVIPNGVDIERFSNVDPAECERVARKFDIDDSRPFVLFVGTIMPRKGVVELVRALGQVAERDEIPTPQTILAGEKTLDEEYTTQVTQAISENDLDEYVHLAGFVDAADLPALYSLADVFVVPSLEEGFGMTAVEAMAAGTPVVGTRVGGIPQLIENRRHGILVEPGDVSGLARGVTDVLDGSNEQRDRITQTKSRAREFSWGAVGAEVTKIYHSIKT